MSRHTQSLSSGRSTTAVLEPPDRIADDLPGAQPMKAKIPTAIAEAMLNRT